MKRSQLYDEFNNVFVLKEGRKKNRRKNTLEVKQKINCKYNQKHFAC